MEPNKSEMNLFGTEPTLSYAIGTKHTKDDVLLIMKRMRIKRATYKAIALFLNEKKLPTFSGNGEWHAQTIHRLCKQYDFK